MRKILVTVIIVLATSLTALAIGELIGKTVAITLQDGTVLQGIVTAETEEAITVGSGDTAVQVKRLNVKAIRLLDFPAEQTTNLSATIDQVGWFAYGAPVKTLEALGCDAEVTRVQSRLTTANTLRLLASLAFIASVVQDLTTQQRSYLAVGGFLAYILGGLVEEGVRQTSRQLAVSTATRQLAGQKGCAVTEANSPAMNSMAH
jgi:hypothetical protein